MKMTTKSVVVKKSLGTSWLSSLFLAVIVGFIGMLLVATNPSWNIPVWEGFVAGLVMTIMTQVIALACLIPFVGIYLYWIWANAFIDWFLGVTHLEAIDIMKWIPLIYCGIFGAIIFGIFTILAIVVIGAIIYAIFNR
jgi:hypothetical protein